MPSFALNAQPLSKDVIQVVQAQVALEVAQTRVSVDYRKLHPAMAAKSSMCSVVTE